MIDLITDAIEAKVFRTCRASRMSLEEKDRRFGPNSAFNSTGVQAKARTRARSEPKSMELGLRSQK